MGRVESATCVIRATTPFEPGPEADIRYDVTVQTDTAIFEMNGVASDLRVYPAGVACFGAPPGSHHPAFVAGDHLRLFITPIPATITCEDIE